MDDLIDIVKTLALGSAVATLITILWRGVWRGLHRIPGRTTGIGAHVLRPGLLLIVAVLWTTVCVLLWKPIPYHLPEGMKPWLAIIGAAVFFFGLILYLWGMKELGNMFRPSSSLGVQLSAEPQLVTTGPYAYMRHPMYAGLIVLALGGLLLFWNWTMIFLLANFMSLPLRAWREEQALARQFGEAWQRYRVRVPAWWPRFRNS